DGSVMVTAMDSTDIVSRIEQIHQSSAVVTAAVGRLATAASIMGSLLKGEQDSLTLRINGGGPAGVIIAVSDHNGNVKACPMNAIVELPLNARGKLDVAGAVGKDGYLSVVRDLGLKEPYTGYIPIVSGEIAEDITYYYAVSEQTPTVCALGVLVNPDLSVKSAGGFLAQLLPFADEEAVDILEKNVNKIASVTSMLAEGKTPTDLCKILLSGLEPQFLGESSPAYHCDCSKKRVERAILSMGKEQITTLIEEDHGTEICCHFCEKKYLYSESELRHLLTEAQK
ncbi:MAG: Hsp33 family molecular chaperone HslO, partial [Oscillospiraceae bacterium]